MTSLPTQKLTSTLRMHQLLIPKMTLKKMKRRRIPALLERWNYQTSNSSCAVSHQRLLMQSREIMKQSKLLFKREVAIFKWSLENLEEKFLVNKTTLLVLVLVFNIQGPLLKRTNSLLASNLMLLNLLLQKVSVMKRLKNCSSLIQEQSPMKNTNWN